MARARPILIRRRVVAALEPGVPGSAALEAAARIAAQLEAELVGLFVEDAELLRFAGLPFAREIGTATAVARALSVSAMERSLRALASAARARLEALAGRSPLPWSFRVARGEISAELLAAASDADLVVTCTAGRGWAAMCTALVAPGRTVPALARVAQALGGGRGLLLLGAPDEAAERWQRKARALLAAQGWGAELRLLRAANELELRALLAELRAGARARPG